MNLLCECGCGETTSGSSKYIFGHWNKDPRVKEKKRLAYQLKYGCNNPNQSSIIKQQKIQTNLKHCGHEHPMQSKEILKKAQKTNEEKYGGLSSMCSEQVKVKARKTCKENHGYENPSQSEAIKLKKTQTNLEHRGTEYPIQSEDIKEQTKRTNLKKYGCIYTFQSDIIKEKIKQKNLEKFGFSNPRQSKEVQEKARQTNLVKFGEISWAKTLQGRQLSRINGIKRRDIQLTSGEPAMPCIGYIERTCLNIIQSFIPHNIIRNDHSFKSIIGRYPDGHIPELKLFIQFDERLHFENREMTIYKKDDIDCTLELASLGYIIFRISEKDWKENQEQVINRFKTLVQELKEFGTN